MEALLTKAEEGCRVGLSKAPWISASAGLLPRLEYIGKLGIDSWTEDQVKDFLYGVLGTGLPSYETSASVFLLNMWSDNPLRIMFTASETGGDTDTIAALACSLACLRNPDSQLPADIEKTVVEMNRLSEYIEI